MNETIVKTEKLTELKNLVSEIEELKEQEEAYSCLDESIWLIMNEIDLKKEKIIELIKTL